MAVCSPIVALSVDNDRLHLGEERAVAHHLMDEYGSGGGIPYDLEFFDSTGRRLVADGPTAGHWEWFTPVDAAAPAPDDDARQAVVQRIDLALAAAQRRLDAHLAAAGGPGPDDRTRMVRVQGDLPEVLVMLSALLPAEPEAAHDPHSGSWWHNFWAHFGG